MDESQAIEAKLREVGMDPTRHHVRVAETEEALRAVDQSADLTKAVITDVANRTLQFFYDVIDSTPDPDLRRDTCKIGMRAAAEFVTDMGDAVDEIVPR